MEERPGLLQKWFAAHVFVPLHGAWFWVAVLGVAAAAVLGFFVLASLPPAARRRLIVTCTFIGGLFYSVDFFWPAKSSPTHGYISPLGNFLKAISAFGVGLGIVSLFSVHGKRVAQRKEGAVNSTAFFLAFFAMLIAAFWQHYATDPNQPSPTITGRFTGPQAFYEVLFNGMLNSLGSTMFSTLAFFITAAAYRAFRIRSAEATVMMVTAFLVMLGGVPVGRMLTNWIPDHGALASLRLEHLMNWILTGPNAAAYRGILFGTMVGMLAMALRIWLSLERGAYFDQRM